MPAWALAISLLAAAGGGLQPAIPELSRQIDRAIAERLSAEHVAPAPRADDCELLRRISLDLIGRIPTIAEIEAFRGDSRPDRTALLIDRLLGDRQHAKHFARVWRSLLLPEAANDPQIAYFQPGFEKWLAERRLQNVGFDTMVRELLAVPISRSQKDPQFVLRDLHRANPVAFLASKQADPAKIAASCVRIFLGVRMECAQCHDHPFDHWTQRQFWSQAAFFGGIERRGRGAFAPLSEAIDRRSIRMNDTNKMIPAALLDGSPSHLDQRESIRLGFANWLTGRKNPYFARAIVNRVWGQLMGTGLVNPVDDFRDSNPPSHPELVQQLADGFVESKYDLTRLYRAICLSEAYQRTSRQPSDKQAARDLFAGMAIKPLSGDQFFDSLSQVVGREWSSMPGHSEIGDEETTRKKVLRMFAPDEDAGSPKTSVPQSLVLMNGSFVDEAVNPQTSPRLKQTIDAFPNSPDGQVDELYLATLSRRATGTERRLMIDYLNADSGVERQRRLGDVLWVLLNSAEFRWNH
jgi:hypothetical protein